MHYREVVIEDDLSIGDSGTVTVDLNVSDPITALIVRFQARNGAAEVNNEPPELQVSKIEIVDGGQTYWSLNGEMSVAAAAYGLGRWPHHWYDERATARQRMNFSLMFGRFIGDPEFAFDPSLLSNPQLKFTYTDQALYLDDSLALGVTARVMEGGPKPSQCLFWKEVEAWTTAASGTHKVDLPTDYPLRAVMMRAYESQNIISNIFDHFKLDCDLGKLIPFDLDIHEMKDILKQTHGPLSIFKWDNVDSGEIRDAWMGETLNANVNPDSNLEIATAYTAFYAFYYAWVFNTSGTGLTNQAIQTLITGYFPHTCLLYPFGRPDEPGTWFPATDFEDVALKIDESDADAAAAVAVQQPRSLP